MRARFLLPALLLPLTAMAGPAGSDVLVDLLAVPGSAGLGALQRLAYQPYRGATVSQDLVPLYMYEGEQFYLHATRVGMKLSERRDHDLEVFLDYRFEGFPAEQTPAVLAGMMRRSSGIDAGIAYRKREPWGNLDAEVLHDANNLSHGTEIRLGYSVDAHSSRLHLRPSIALAHRNSSLNNYYYGVRPGETRADRPAYQPGPGVDLTLGLFGYYEVTERWRLLAGVGVTLLDAGVRNSPIVDDKWQPNGLVGAAYDFGSHKPYSEPGLPLRMKVYGGRATECNFLPAATFRCGSTRTPDDTRIWGVDFGRPLIEQVNRWPLDFVAWVGLQAHDERGRSPDALQLNAHIKAYYYGFPWRERMRTRVAFGAGFSMAQRVPLVELEDQARRGRETSRFLNYLDPSLDVNVGDLFRARRLKQIWAGIGVSHRSGIFGASQILGNINGGSNYLYGYVESTL
ncbi:MipA/OmpV family protein [Massilia sp. R2A-15]|uniref:MipA/OmpV family protein n=1 Tax=Massilia sp. R2A-15 TaxID=3064278 RepID=UPI002732F433|nr:MipA/OmpV family protein [Massilia sp. R2A-15]WLI90457.1 MipA/OmpV family protein [Massilia sp. R2A-15]